MKDLRRPIYFICLLFCFVNTYAQGIIKGDTTYNKWQSSIVRIKSIYKRDNSSVNDTLIGTGFLLADHDRLYLVTAKHLIQSTLYGKNEQLPNDAITIDFLLLGPGITADKLTYDIDDLPGKDAKHPAVAFTDDEQDIGIISLQKREYAELVDSLLINGRRPIPIGLIDAGNDHHAGEWLFWYGFYAGRKTSGGGMAVSKIKEYDPLTPVFTIGGSFQFGPGNNGSPVTANDKMIGMLTNPAGILSNQDIIQRPKFVIPDARVIRSSYIIACLRKLQQMEADPAFEK